MSRHTEYAVWEDAVGQWNAAIYQSHATGSHEDEAWDEIWGYEYNYDRLSWVSENHSSLEEARKAVSRMNGNPGHGGNVYQFSTEPDMVEQMNLLVKFLKDPAFAKQHRLEKDKETVAKKHKAIRENLEKNNGYNGQFITVVFGSSTEAVASSLGMFTSKDGYVKKNKNGWLTVADREFYNPTTGEVNELVAAVKKPQAYRPGF